MVARTLRTATLLLGLTAPLGLAACVAVPDGVTPVTDFDLDRYLGNWYEIARLDHSFERDLTNVTATYSLREDGSVRVLNSGFDPRSCTFDTREGRATFNGDPTVASLGVSFFGPFKGGYHVIDLASDYSYALVSGPNKDFLWILSRSPSLPEATLQRLINEARSAGFPVDELIIVSHGETSC